MTDWCILRTAPSRTLGLAKALGEAGFEVWTSIEEQVRRAGRSRKRVEHQAPLTPSFLFARYDRVREPVAMSHSPSQTYQRWDSELRRMVTHGIPHFTVFRHLSAYPRVTDAALEPLRRIERSNKPKSKVRVFKLGEEVRYPDAGFGGLTGKVEGLQGRYAIVVFPGLPIAVKIDARHLIPFSAAA
jgi:hypothetical protein